MVRVNPLAQYQQAIYNARVPPRARGGVTFMPPVPVAPRRAQRAAAPIAARQAAMGMSLADRIRANDDVFAQDALEGNAPEQGGGGFKEDAIHGLGWIVGNPVSRAILKPLEVLDYPRAAVVGGIRQGLESDLAEGANRALAKLPGIDYTPIARPEDNEAGFQWSEMWRDIKKHEGFGTSIVEPQFGPEGRDWNIWARRGLGFAGDIGADPFSYLSIGTHAAPGTEARISAMNKLLDAQNAAKIEGRAATEAAETADDWARLIGGTGADEAQQATAAAAQQAQQRLEDLTTIRGQDAQSLIGRRGVNVATPEQLRVMGQQQHAIRFGGVPIPGAASEAASRAMSRMLSPGKELFTRTAGAQGRKLFNPTGVLGQKLAPATERILTGEGPLSMEKALRTHAVDQAMRLARGEFRAPARQFLHQLDESLQGISREDRAALVKAAEEQGVENSTTKMAENMIATMRAMGLDPPELKPWALPNGAQSKYVMPHVLSRDAFRFFNKLRKGDNPLIDFIRRDLGVTDKDLLEEGGFLQRRLFRPNADGSPQVFKIGKDEVTITTGSVAELEEKLGGLLRQHGFEGNLYESNPVEAWRRYIKSTEKDVARNVALKHGAENFGMEGLRNKPEAPRSYDPYGRDLKMQPAEGETDPRYIRGEATSRRPADTDVYEMVADDKATEARNKIITEGGDKNVHQQVLGEYREAAPAVRENLAHQIEATREYTEAAFDKARAQSAKKLTRAEKIVSDTRATVDKLETEYVELLKEASANDRLIEAGQSAIHGVRSQTPKNIKRAIQERLDEIARQLEHERGRLESLQGGLKHALEASEQKQIDDRLEAFASRHEAVLRAEKDLESTRKKATAAVAKRIDRETKGRDHLISEIEHRQAQEFVGRGDNARSRRAAELLERRDSLTAQEAIRRNQALDLQRQAERIEEALSRRTGGSTPRTEARQARIEAGQVNQAAEARRLRRQARVETNRANKLADDLRDAERRIKDDDWLKAQRVVEQYAEQQEMINGYSNAATRVDMRAAQGRLHAAQADMRSYELDESLAAKAAAEANKTPLQRSEDRLTEAIGAKPDVSYAISPPDDLPGGEEGLHRIILTTEAAPPKGEAAASTLPEWMQGSTPNARTGTDPADPQYVSSLIWSAKSGEVMMISVDEAFRRKGIGTRMYDYATEYAKENGLQPPQHSSIQTAMGKQWAPESDKQIAWWSRNPENTKGLNSFAAEKARNLLDSPEAREYVADETIASHLRDEIRKIENPAEDTTPVDWTEIGHKPPGGQPPANRAWSSHNSRRRRLMGEMERVRDEAYFTKPPDMYGKSVKRAGKKRLRGYEPWWSDKYPTRIDQSSTKASRTRRLNRLQKELDKEDAWLAKHPKPPHPKPNPRASKFKATIGGKVVRLERNTDVGALGGAGWKIILHDGTEMGFSGDLTQAWKEAERAAKEQLTKVEPDQAALSDLRSRLAGAEARMRLQDQGALALPGRQEWEQPYSQTWWRDSRDVFGEELGEVIDEGDRLWNDVENMDSLADSELVGLVQDEWRRLTPEGQARMRELGWENGQAPFNPEHLGLEPGWRHPADPLPINERIKAARRTLAGAAREQSFIPPKAIPPPTPESLVRKRFEPNIAEAEQRVKQMGTRGTPEELEGVRAPIQQAADERIAGIQGEEASLRFQNQRIESKITDLYQNRMPDPVNDWHHALDNAEEARQIHQEISDYIEKYAVRQRAIDIVEKNRRAGAPTAADLKRVAEHRLRPADAQGLMAAVDDINKFMTGAADILPKSTAKRIEAALMSYEQALHSLTTTNDLPAAALERMTKEAHNGKLPKVLKAQLRETWREVGQDGSIIIDKDLERAFFGVEQVLDSKLFGPLFTTWTNFFKTYATLTPGFHVRNAISAIFMNATEGVGAREQIRAIKLWNQYRRSENPIEWLASRSAAERDAFRATFASGAGGQFLEAGVGEARGGASRMTERLFANKATRASKGLGEWVEGPQRLALGLHTTQAGGTAGDALSRITRIHFDYGQVSKFDEQMKRIIPFWTFMSRNIPLQFTQMWMKPKMYLRYQSMMRNLRLGNEDDPLIPSYIKSGGGEYFGVKTPGWASKIPLIGPPEGMPIVMQPDLPQSRYNDDLQRLTNALSGQGIGQMATNLNPLITVPAEFAGRTDFFTGQQFDKTDRVQVGGAALPYALALSLVGQARRGADGKWYVDAAALNAARGLDPNLDRMMRLMPQLGGLEGTDKTGASTNARQAESWARYAGLPFRTISPQQQRSELRSRAFKERDRRRELLNSGG